MEAFKKHIEAYIQGQIEADPMFADIYNKSERSIEDCITYYDESSIMRSALEEPLINNILVQYFSDTLLITLSTKLFKPFQ